MIYLFTTFAHKYTTCGIHQAKGARVPARTRSYSWLFRRYRHLRASAVVFTDFDRLDYERQMAVTKLAKFFQEQGVRVLNRPGRVMERFELLHSLHRSGMNPYKVWRAEMSPSLEASDFPVFLKSEGSHDHPLGGILNSQAELDDALIALRRAGIPLHFILVTQFVDAPVREGVWMRYTSYRIANQVFAGLPVFENAPFVKYGTLGLPSEKEFAYMQQVVRENHHAEQLKRLFEHAGIEYGRADYMVKDGQVILFEINTNPTIPRKHGSSRPEIRALSAESQMQVARAVAALDGPDVSMRLPKSYRGRAWF